MPLTSTKEDSSAAVWLHNKLVSSTHLWSFSSTVASQYTYEKLQSIKESFPTLEPLVKIKFFLTLLYIPKRNIEEFRQIVQEIIDATIDNCFDQWVLSIAQFIQSFWQSQCLNTESDYDNLESFKESYNELIKSFEKCMDSEDGNERAKYLMPIECEYLSKKARLSILSSLNFLIEDESESSPNETAIQAQPNLTTLIGSIDSMTKEPKKHKPVQHFSLTRQNKLNSQIEDLKDRASKYQKIKPNKSIGLAESTDNNSNKLSFINRGTSSKKLDSMTMGSQYSSGSSSFFKRSLTTNVSTITGKSSIVKRDVGIKLLDSDEQIIFNPREAKRKRKEQEKEALKKVKQEEKEAKLKAKEQTKPDERTEESVSKTNHSENEEDNSISESAPPLPTFSTQPAQIPTPQMTTFNDLFNSSSSNGSHFQNAVPIPFPYQTQNINLTPTKMINPNLILSQQNSAPTQLSQPSQPKPPQLNQEPPENKRQSSLTLTREQMVQAQELFANSNMLSRPEKALILSFIAGSRDNPRPDQGPVLLIKLNEIQETMTSVTGEQHEIVSETYLQMNYETGEYKKLKKNKLLN